MSGPTAPLTRAFIFCGWRCITIDWLINPQHDLANPDFQQELHEMLQQADCICAALDCSTKSRAREIPRRFEDGRPAPKPLRSDEYPTGLPHLRGRDLRQVTRDNQACDFVPIEEARHFVRTRRACTGNFPGTNTTQTNGSPTRQMDSGCSPAMRRQSALHHPRMPPTESVGRLYYDLRSMRSWAMTPLAIQLGLRPVDPRERARVHRVKRVADLLVDGKLPPKCIYVGRGRWHHSHRLPLSEWCSPYTPGHDCTADEWLPCYVEFIMPYKAAELPALAGCTLACRTATFARRTPWPA